MDLDNFCAPHRVDMMRSTGTCLTHADLTVVANAWNNSNPGSVIPRAVFTKKSLLWKAINDRFANSCGSLGEHCWVQKVQQTPNVKAVSIESFKPLKPSSWYKNKNEWLNTYDILLVMKQYEKLHKDFKFVGVFPRDFAFRYDGVHCVSREMCDPSVFDRKKNVKKYGFIFNHDTHDQPGSHWVALFLCFDQSSKLFGSHYFDSTGKEPKPEIMDFMNKMSREHDLPIASIKSPIRKQFKNTECGMFSLNFLIQCIDSEKHISYHDIVRHMGTDDQIARLREIFYTPNYLANNTSGGSSRKNNAPKTPKMNTKKTKAAM